MEDVHKNIASSIVTVRLKVDSSFNDVKNKVDPEIKKFLSQVAEEIKKSNNLKAANLYAKLTQEWQKPDPSKPALRGFWDDLSKILDILFPKVPPILGKI